MNVWPMSTGQRLSRRAMTSHFQTPAVSPARNCQFCCSSLKGTIDKADF